MRALREMLADVREALAIVALAIGARRDPEPFLLRTAESVGRHLRERGAGLHGVRALDAGTGSGAVAASLRRAGARAVGVDVREHRFGAFDGLPFAIARGEVLPFADATFGVVVSSNVLEHVPDRWAIVREAVRVCEPGGWIHLSWTNWLSPLGGHELSPFHYLGARVADAVYRATRGRPPRNRPGRSLFTVHVGEVLAGLRRGEGGDVEVVDVAPRYWPALRALARVPGVREVVLGNCAIVLRRRGDITHERAAPAARATRGTPRAL